MAANGGAALRSLELRLLRCSIPSEYPSPPAPSPTQTLSTISHLHSLLKNVVSLIGSGHYLQALSSSQTIFTHLKLYSSVSASCFYTEILPECVSSFLSNDCDNRDSEEIGYRALLLMAVGVAALLAFIQCNITGPVDKLPCMPIAELWIRKDEIGDSDWMQWEKWAYTELMSFGSDVLGKLSNLQYLIFAKTLLLRTKDLLFERDLSSIHGVRSITWWLARVLFLQQRLLDERSSCLFDLLQVFKQETLCYFGSLEKIEDYWGANEDGSTALSMLHLELGTLELYYGREDASRLHFESAAEISRYNLFVSGSLGFRTLHQEEPKAQLRLVSGTNGREAGAQLSLESDSTDDSPIQQSHETSEASDIFMTPRFVVDESQSEGEDNAQNHAISTSQLKTVHQAMALAQCLLIEKGSRGDELQRWEMAPYIEAIDSQNSSPYTIQYFSKILRVRWEKTRSRTKQRALLMMDKLVQGIDDISPGVAQRIYYSFGVNIPTIPALRKEFGDQLVNCGCTGEALKIYEDLELWDDLIHCYKLIGKKTAAVQLIKERLIEKPSDQRLWCSLGDVTNDDAHYEKALEVSENRSARAFSSLARSAYDRKDYEKSKLLWESAMALNTMYPDGWFALGAAALRSMDVDKALDSFTRAIQLDPENWESWNNIGFIFKMKNRNKESFIAFKEAVKLKRNMWQIWESYSQVAADIGNFRQAMEAMLKVLDLTKKTRIDIKLLERIMLEIEKQVEESAGKRETEQLIQLLGQVLKQIVQNGGSSDSWGLYARWHKIKGDFTMCSEALLKQVRSYQGSDLWKDKDRFVKFSRASLELCKVYQEIALHGNSRKELFAAEMHLKSTIKQAVNFSDTEEFRDLVVCLEEVQESMKAIA